MAITPIISDVYTKRIQALISQGGRRLLGLVGPPGSGKSTLALMLCNSFADISQIVPMDGFHLAQVELERLGRAGRKGAPDTFDSAGYAALLKRLKHQRSDEIIYAPDFRRAIEEPVAGAIPVFAQTRLVITEGNYLLLDSDHWSQAAAQLDDVWYVEVEDALRNKRLAQRHQTFGRSEEAALAWIASTDDPNAALIASTRSRARLIFQWTDD